MEPIEEIDSKKRRTRIENAQRSAAHFRTSAAKERKQSASEARVDKGPQADSDSLEFSSEFTSQDSGLSGDTGTADTLDWQQLIEDDDWLSDTSDEEEGGEGQQEPEPESEEELEEEPEDSHQEAAAPAARPGFGTFKSTGSGLKAWSPKSVPGAQTQPGGQSKPAVEKQLGFEWGAVQKSQEKPKDDSGPAIKLDKPAAETAEPVRAFNPPPKKLPPRKSELAAGVLPAHQDPARYVPPRPRPEPQMPLPPTGRLEGVEQRVLGAARLLITTPEGAPGYEECLRLLCRFGLGALRLCSRQKVKVAIIDEQDFPVRPELQEFDLEKEELPVDGAYIVSSRTCLIDRRCLLEKPRFFHPALYYFSHALDHAQGGEVFSSRKAAAVLACFEASTEGYNGCDFVDELAAADPIRYFARSVSIYLGRDDVLEPIWDHQDLRHFDKSMFDYLEYLFARFAV